ncbi:hypothetical protein JXB02_02060 [Candidatus Woesearchaeota archaeon]|nr:hypothetical protein [Candidatus Woesearchaeota archaeon]
MPRDLLLVLILVLFVPAGFACERHADCPAPRCAGAVSYCHQGTCSQTACIVEEPTGTSEVPSFKESLAPYERAINFSKPQDYDTAEKTFLEAVGIGGIIGNLFKTIIIVAVTLLVVFILIFARERSWHLFAAILAILVVAIVLIGLLAAAGIDAINALNPFRPHSWDETGINEFRLPASSESYSLQPQRRWLSFQERQLLSEDVVQAYEYKGLTSGDDPFSVMVLEFADRAKVAGFSQPWLRQTDDIKTVRGEEVYLGPVSREGFTVSKWDEDRFVFVVVAPRDDVQGISGLMVSRYPAAATPNVIPVSDSAPPAIAYFGPVGYSRERDIRFTVIDGIAGVRLESITLDPFGGFSPVRDCRVLSETRGRPREVGCSYTLGDGQEGAYTVTVSASDTANNIGTFSTGMVFDVGLPDLLRLVPSDRYTGLNHVELSISDALSPFDADNLSIDLDGEALPRGGCSSSGSGLSCAYDGVLVEGENHLSVSIPDLAGNTLSYSRTIVLDSAPPRLRLLSPSSQLITSTTAIVFEAADDGAGINLATVLVDDQPFDREERCADVEGGYRCGFDFGTLPQGKSTVMIEAADLAGNIGRDFFLVFHDSVAPVLTMLSAFEAGFLEDEESILIAFEVADDYAGVVLDSVGVNTLGFDAAEDCALIDTVVSCAFYASAASLSDAGELRISAMDGAGNTETFSMRLH